MIGDAHAARRRSSGRDVFAEVYEPLQRYVRRRADAAAVDDVVADTMLVLWRRLDDVPADPSWPGATGRPDGASPTTGAPTSGATAWPFGSPASRRSATSAACRADPELAAALDELSADDRSSCGCGPGSNSPRGDRGRARRSRQRGVDPAAPGQAALAERSLPERTPLAGHKPVGDHTGHGRRVPDGRARRATPPQRPAPSGLVTRTIDGPRARALLEHVMSTPVERTDLSRCPRRSPAAGGGSARRRRRDRPRVGGSARQPGRRSGRRQAPAFQLPASTRSRCASRSPSTSPIRRRRRSPAPSPGRCTVT